MRGESRVELVLRALGVPLVRANHRRGWALCPYHGDADGEPSWFIRFAGKRRGTDGKMYSSVGQHFCFSCKSGGTLRALVMHVRKCAEDEAKEFVRLAGEGFEPPRVQAKVVPRPPSAGRRAFRMPREVIFEPLRDWVTGAREYAEGRGISAEEAEEFGLGYAVDGRLAGRVVFPWRRPGGAPAGYSARTFVDDEPKYVTPHESELADLGVMFGESRWEPRELRKIVVVTEGAINALAVRRAVGFGNQSVAAIGGSEVHPGHAIKLATFETVVLLTDADEAGDKVARELASVLGRYAEIRRARPPVREVVDPKTGEKTTKALDAADLSPAELRDLVERSISTPPRAAP